MRCLTVHAGWAWGLIHGPKRIENRTWSTMHRGPLAIHAGRSLASQAEARRLMPEMPPDECLSWGAIVGVVDLVDVIIAPGGYHWITANPRPLARPLPYRGRQGLFIVPDAILEGRLALPA